MLLAFVFTLSSHSIAQIQAEPFVLERTYLLPSAREVAVTFHERFCRSGECHETDGGVWGIDEGTPQRIADAFVVLIDGRQFIIPAKFYTDLTNTHSLEVFEREERIIIELKGGDAAGAYTARFLLGGTCGFERNVCGEVCGEIWERTVWYNSFAYEGGRGCISRIQ